MRSATAWIGSPSARRLSLALPANARRIFSVDLSVNTMVSTPWDVQYSLSTVFCIRRVHFVVKPPVVWVSVQRLRLRHSGLYSLRLLRSDRLAGANDQHKATRTRPVTQTPGLL